METRLRRGFGICVSRWDGVLGGGGGGGAGTQTLSAGSPAPEGRWGKEILKIKETLTCL